MPTTPADDRAAEVVEGVVVDAPTPPSSSAPPRQLRVVDEWSSVAPKVATRTMTLIALAPLLILPFVLLATRLPAPVRPILALLAVAVTAYSYIKLRRPVRRTYQVSTAGIALVNQDGETVRLPYDSVSDLAIELSGADAGATAIVVQPRGPLQAGSRATKRPDGSVRIGFPHGDAARLDAAIRAAGATAYRGIVRG